ncbi:MAG TPA: hypothetical protein VGF24_10650 [Vicinamibacterales bacterium]|jgi:hypothetical protein
MNTISRLICVAILVNTIALVAQDKVDVTGKWVFTVETSAGTGTPTVTFKQDGEKITGHYSSMTLGEADFTGTVKGRDIAFNFMANVLDMQIPVSYTGTIEGKDAMKGKIVITGVGDGTFTGKRQ